MCLFYIGLVAFSHYADIFKLASNVFTCFPSPLYSLGILNFVPHSKFRNAEMSLNLGAGAGAKTAI
jgi:hypothetical protein